MKREEPKLLLGAHLSVAGGFENALYDGQKIGCTAVQIFTHSNRQWYIKSITQDEVDRFEVAKKKTGITCLVVHASYLINLASAKEEQRALSLKTLVKELERCEQLGITYLVLHPGSYVDGTEDAGVHHLILGLTAALEQVPGTTMVLLENMAGQGSSIGRRLEQLALIRNQIRHKERVGICIDTCHLFAAGYDLGTPEGYVIFWKEFDTIIGIEHLRAIHLNDSKNICGSHVDRHAHIGEGKMGIGTFELLMNDPRFFAIPKILETPKEKDLAGDVKNLAILKGLLTDASRKALRLD